MAEELNLQFHRGWHEFYVC